jgi:hypothetical protein
MVACIMHFQVLSYIVIKFRISLKYQATTEDKMDKTSQNSTAMPNSRLNAPSIIRKLKSSLLVTMLLGLGLGVVGVVYLIGEYRQVKNNAINELTSLADLKVTQVTNWIQSAWRIPADI